MSEIFVPFGVMLSLTHYNDHKTRILIRNQRDYNHLLVKMSIFNDLYDHVHIENCVEYEVSPIRKILGLDASRSIFKIGNIAVVSTNFSEFNQHSKEILIARKYSFDNKTMEVPYKMKVICADSKEEEVIKTLKYGRNYYYKESEK